MQAQEEKVTVKNRCTLFPDSTYADCCKLHDTLYRIGEDRAGADQELLICVAQNGRPWLAVMMFLGVRLFGWPFWLRHKWRKK